MNHISNMLINTYKPLNTLPDLIPRNFKLMCTCKHTHTLSRGDLQVSTLPLLLLPAAHWYLHRSWFIAGVGSHASCLFSRCCLLHGQLALLCLSEVRVLLQGVSVGDTSGFDYCCFHITIYTPFANCDPSFMFPFKLIPSLFQKLM